MTLSYFCMSFQERQYGGHKIDERVRIFIWNVLLQFYILPSQKPLSSHAYTYSLPWHGEKILIYPVDFLPHVTSRETLPNFHVWSESPSCTLIIGHCASLCSFHFTCN